jgi:surfeit locus 1 family protein
MKRQRIWPVLIAAGIGFAILCSLGTWQVNRLAWKEALIAEIDASLAEPARSVANISEIRSVDEANKKIRLKGRFSGPTISKMASLNGGPGWEIVSFFELDHDQSQPEFRERPVILVSRGIAADQAPEANVSGSTIEVEGILKLHPPPGQFDVANNPMKHQYFTWDVARMTGELGGIVSSPLVLHLLPGSPGTEGLHVDPPKSNLRNNHLGYAITWFGLAAALVGVTGAFIWRSTRF